jgi:hypothetical protein
MTDVSRVSHRISLKRLMEGIPSALTNEIKHNLNYRGFGQ